MNREQALIHYNNLTNSSIQFDDLKYFGQGAVYDALDALVKCSEMVKNAGGQLRSRQVMAAIIYFAEKNQS